MPFTSLMKIAVAARDCRNPSLWNANKVPDVMEKLLRHALQRQRGAPFALRQSQTISQPQCGQTGRPSVSGQRTAVKGLFGFRVRHAEDLPEREGPRARGKEEVLGYLTYPSAC